VEIKLILKNASCDGSDAVMKHTVSTIIEEQSETEPLTVSLKTLAVRLDASRPSVRRWLSEAGIQPIAMSDGRNGAIRYRWSEVKVWLNTRQLIG
jgi:hypothetical protein